MNKVWVLNLDIVKYFYNVVENLQKETRHKLNSHEREIVFLEVMKIKKIKPAGQNELTKAEFIKELVSKGKKILNVDKDGFTFIKKGVKNKWEIK